MRARRRFHEVRAAASDDLAALEAGLDVLDGDGAVARELSSEAARRLEEARVPGDLEAVTAAIEQGRHSLAEAEARLAGKPPPERRAPCFFDPRHGPSARDVVWTPPGGAARAVPACE